VAVGLPLVIWFFQDRLIFFPRPLEPGRREQLLKRAPLVEEVALAAEDGTKLHGWLARPAAPGRAPLVIYFGGNAEEASWILDEPERPADWAWLAVSYRGYGLSQGSPGEAALVSDARRIYDFAKQRADIDPQRIHAFGRSLGSGVAVALAAQRPLAGVILVSPFDSLAAVAKRHYWYLPVDLMLRHRFDSIALAPKLRQPLLCLISERDEIIPPEHAERLFAAWGGAKRKIVLQEAGHNSSDAHPMFWQAVRGFLEKKDGFT